MACGICPRKVKLNNWVNLDLCWESQSEKKKQKNKKKVIRRQNSVGPQLWFPYLYVGKKKNTNMDLTEKINWNSDYLN